MQSESRQPARRTAWHDRGMTFALTIFYMTVKSNLSFLVTEGPLRFIGRLKYLSCLSSLFAFKYSPFYKET